MRHGSLFSGIGGFDLAAEWMGWENVFHCEWNPFGQKVLKYYWPNAISYNDITKTDFTIHRGSIDILTGGFPCQPYSLAGKRKGKEDERHLWPEMLRAIREIQPRWVVGENVYGLVNWSGGLVFYEVQTDLEAEGYEVFPYVLPACAVNAPHRRDRAWFVAYRNTKQREWEKRGFQSKFVNGCKTKAFANTTSNGFNDESAEENNGIGEDNIESGTQWISPVERLSNEWSASNSDSKQRPEGWMYKTERKEAERYTGARNAQSYERNTWHNFPTQSPVCSGNDGFPIELDGITFSKWRNESIKAAGNAIVPQVACQIFKAIEQFEFINE